MKIIFAALFLIVYASSGVAMTPFPELTQTEVTKLTNRELVIHSRDIPKSPWPEITVFALIDALPGEAAALFSNYQDHKRYIPDLIKSDPVRKVAENETIVDFEMTVPWPLPNSKYSTGNVLNKIGNTDYQISWYLVESNSLVDTKGTVHFAPYGKKTLLKYKSLIHPVSKLAALFSSKAENGLTKTVRAIVEYVEETKRKNPEKILKSLGSLPR